jgi:hypothetical protein
MWNKTKMGVILIMFVPKAFHDVKINISFIFYCDTCRVSWWNFEKNNVGILKIQMFVKTKQKKKKKKNHYKKSWF